MIIKDYIYDYDIVIGCDPGKTGGICSIDINKNEINVYEMPCVEINKGSKKKPKIKKEIDEIKLVNIFRKFKNKKVIVGLERVSSMPGEGSVSSFNFGSGWGLIKGAVYAFEYKLELVSPVSWKKIYPNLDNDLVISLKEKRSDIKENIAINYNKKEKNKEISKINSLIKREAKKEARNEAKRLFPNNKNEFDRAKDDGKAEALLIANWIKEKYILKHI